MATESPEDRQITTQQPLLATKTSSRGRSSSSTINGGFRSLPFIIATDALEKVVTYGLSANMIIYLTTEYGMKNSDGANLLFIWVAATNFTPVVAAFLADSYVGRYRMIAAGSLAHILGTSLLWLTASFPEARPAAGDQATAPQLCLLYAAFALISVGSGCMRSSNLAFCADQIGVGGTAAPALESLVSWYSVSTMAAILTAVTVIVYIQESAGWRVGFGVPLILMVLSALIFISGSSLYVEQKTDSSFLVELAQVAVAAAGGGDTEPRHNYHSKPGGIATPSENLKFLNRACIIHNPEKQLNPDGTASNPWKLCTVEQVEDFKSVIRVIPIWFAGVVMSLPTTQQPFYLLQLKTMDRHLTESFQIPAASFSLFIMLALLAFVPLYNRVIVPVASAIKGKPTRLSLKQRLGLGILLSSVSMAALAVLETVRRGRAIDGGMEMSAMWFLVYYLPFGVAEAFNYIAQNEFYYSELPKSMASISTTLYSVGLSTGSLVASMVLSSVEMATEGEGGESTWIASDINNGHYNYYYWVIACLIALDFVYYLVCAKAYGACRVELCCEGLEDAGEAVDQKGN